MLVKYLRSRLPVIIFYIIFITIYALYLTLMSVDIKIVIYPAAVSTVILLIFLSLDFLRNRHKANVLSRVKDFVQAQAIPSSEEITEECYQEIISSLSSQYKKDLEEYKSRSSDYSDYINMWVHQIKNPIASMRLELNDIDSEESRRLKGELNRIEHYVDMVLVYSKLNADTTDYVFEKTNIKDACSSAVKKFKENFISMGLSLSMEADDTIVLTDRKWLEFILEQYISNALKYTSEGKIRIYNEGPKVFVEDTGIGIRPEDKERIWEKGYTGINGRTVGNSSGLGLYLVKKTADKLNHSVGASDSPSGGSTFFIDLTKKEKIYE
ncbi:MAG: sensor histidine kinase [Saccharofermentans sp.]|nr:sensor histidine kinase [Saccharofermentans sp.]